MNLDEMLAKVTVYKEKVIDVRKSLQMYDNSIAQGTFIGIMRQLMSVEGFLSYLEKEFKVMNKQKELKINE